MKQRVCQLRLMKYYSEEETQGIRSAFEKEVLLWDQVSTKRMFGCPCYKVNDRLFSFLVTKGAVITHLNQTDREALALEHGSAFFNAGKKIVNIMRNPFGQLAESLKLSGVSWLLRRRHIRRNPFPMN